MDGGETKLGNLVLLCRHHHRLVHEGGFTLSVERGELGELVFRRPDGRVLEPVPTITPLNASAEASLIREHQARGLQIDARTPTPGWFGERADYDYLLALIADRDRLSTIPS